MPPCLVSSWYYPKIRKVVNIACRLPLGSMADQRWKGKKGALSTADRSFHIQWRRMKIY